MQGRQFNWLATDVDVAAVEESLRAAGNIAFYQDLPAGDPPALVPLETLPIPLDFVGKVSLGGFLAPTSFPPQIVIDRTYAISRVDHERSHLIEFSRPYFTGTEMGWGARFFYFRYVAVGGGYIAPNDPTFCAWADKVFKRVKKLLKYDLEFLSYVGPDAAQRIATGEITVLSNLSGAPISGPSRAIH